MHGANYLLFKQQIGGYVIVNALALELPLNFFTEQSNVVMNHSQMIHS